MGAPLSYMISFFWSQWFVTLPVQTRSFAGQTIIVTGSNTGLGFEATKSFVRLGAAKVILAVRDAAKGAQAAEAIAQSTGGGAPAIIEVWDLDLASYASVRAFAARASELDRLDVVVANAGMMTQLWSLAEDNERTVTVDYVSTMLLGMLLLPKLRETAVRLGKPSVLTFTGSFVHWITDFPEQKEPDILASLADKSKANMADRYNVVKLLQLLAGRELANQVTESEKPGRVVVSVINPGSVVSGMARDPHGPIQGFGLWALRTFVMRGTEAGARTLVHAAYGDEETHGQYLSDCKVARPSYFARGSEGMKVQKKVWEELVAKCEEICPGVAKNI